MINLQVDFGIMFEVALFYFIIIIFIFFEKMFNKLVKLCEDILKY